MRPHIEFPRRRRCVPASVVFALVLGSVVLTAGVGATWNRRHADTVNVQQIIQTLGLSTEDAEIEQVLARAIAVAEELADAVAAKRLVGILRDYQIRHLERLAAEAAHHVTTVRGRDK